MNTLGLLAGMGLFAMLIMFVVSILVGGLVLCLAFRMVVGFMPSYLRALGAVLLTLVIGFVVSFVLRMVLPMGLSGFLSLVVNLLVGGAVINYLLPAQDGQQIGYGKAVLVQLINLVIFILLAVIIGVLFAIFFGSMLAASH
ncbi:hypothetical protein [Rhodanobacter sp. L36]|uniref:hypothetical protein n=1 Tax=Rhodanobacter sp. L36 TaxID=1747221 RepID=UPI00131B9E59|nr:hypothetical protein [Rhodanobacter sp. L36]